MSTPGSSNPAHYRYPVQPQDRRASQQYYPQPNASTSTNTSTASAYAYAQQQARQAHSSSSTSTSASYPYVPPQVQRQAPPQPQRPTLLSDRAHSIDELAKLAAQDHYNRYADIKQDLRHAEVYLLEANKDFDAGDLEWAFVNYARTATLVLNKMPTNTAYLDMKPAHRESLSMNGNFCLDRLGEIKPKLVDRFELWRRRNPNVKVELDTTLILRAMAVRDQDELVIRAQASKEKRAASKEEAARKEEAVRREEAARKEEAARRTYAEEDRRRAEAASKRPEPHRPDYDEESRRRQERQVAERKAYEDARRRKEAEEKSRAAAEAEYASRLALDEEAKRSEMERRRREAEEQGRRREEEIAKRKQEAQRQEQEAVTRRKIEDLEYRRKMEESRRREQEGIAQRQREAEAEAEASKKSLQPLIPVPVSAPPIPSPARVSMPVPTPAPAPPDSFSSSSTSSSSDSSSTTNTLTPGRQDALPILPLESPTHENSDDPRKGRHHPQPQVAVTERAVGRTKSYQPPITTTSPPPGGRPLTMQYPSLMTEHQRAQGYTPSLQSMFSPPIGDSPAGGLLFRPNNPEGPSMRNMPSSPDRPPAHIRHMWEQAGYGYQYANPSSSYSKPKPPPAPGDSRILRPEQVRDDAATIIGKELRIVKVPQNILPRFLGVAAVNTARNRETCGLLMGRENGKEYKVTTLLIPKQRATSDTCTMDEEELVSEFAETRKLLTLGWIHTHPTQSCFMSSLDLHTHAGFQCMLPEFFAIVCAPKHVPDCGIFRLTDPPGLKTILKCKEKASFHPHPENPIYTDADKGHVVWVDDASLEIVDLR